jgi:Cof subfamily protein (haloacid dehalogenase superfamily)
MRKKMIPASIKMLVIDIDGTLLNPDGEITPLTRETVQAARSAGILVTLATARRYCNTFHIADDLGLDIPLILYDGAMIVQHPERKIVHTRPLNAAIAQEAVDVLARHGIQPVVHPDTGLDEQIWTGPESLDNMWLEAYFTTFPGQMHRMPLAQLCAGHPDPVRVVAFTSEEAIQGVIPDIAQLDCSWTSIKRGSYGSAELVVMDAHCSKASGVAALAQHFNLSMQDVMALGDNNNDIEMLKSVGWGVAMEQAPQAVKAAADAIAASNRHDGAALAIQYYALGDGLRAVRAEASSAASNSRRRAT